MSAAVISTMKDEIAELRSRIKALELAQASEPVKTKRSKKEKDPDAPKKPLSAWATLLKEVYMPLLKEALDGKKMPTGLGLKVAGYLHKQGNTAPALDEVKKAIEYLEANPDYKSDTQKSRSESGSVSEKKPRGRPPKAKKTDDKPKPTVVTPKAEQEEEEEEAYEHPKFSAFTFKGVEYLKDEDENELFSSEGDMKWVGTWNGKKIVKGEMSERVKKILAAED